MRSVFARSVVLGEGRPKICVPLAPEPGKAAAAASLAKDSGADLLEFRADLFLADGHPAEALPKTAKEMGAFLPVLFTIRTEAEGGAFRLGTDAYRDLLLRQIRAGAADLADVELSLLQQGILTCREISVPVVASYHSFAGTPDREVLTGKLRAMEACGASLAKIAVMTKTKQDLDILRKTAEEAQAFLSIPMILIGMGEYGIQTRTDPAGFGSCLTFGAAGLTSAPGQIPASRLYELFAKMPGNG